MNRLKNRLSRILKGYWARMPPAAWWQLLISMIPYAAIGYIVHKLSWLYSCCAGSNLFSRLSVLLNNVPLAFGRPIMSLRAQDLLTGLAAAVVTRLCVALKGKNKRKYRTGSEYGSARWGTSRDIAPFIDPVYENNILLTATERLTMNGRPALPK